MSEATGSLKVLSTMLFMPLVMDCAFSACTGNYH